MPLTTALRSVDKARLSRLTREGSWVILGQIASVAGALVLVRVLTTYLDPVQFGELALGLTISGLVNQVVMGGISAGIGRFYSIAAEKQDLGCYLHASMRLLGYSTLVVLTVGTTLAAALVWFDHSQWLWLALAALAFSISSGYNSTLSGIQNAARQRATVAFHSGLDAWLKILLAVLAITWLGNASVAVVIGYIFSSMLITFSQLIFLRRSLPLGPTSGADCKPWMHQVWAYSWPFSTWGIFTWMQQVADRWALQAFASTADVGQYAVLFQLGFTPVAMATAMATSFLGPILYQRSGDATDHARNRSVHRIGWRMTNIALLLTLICFVLTFALHGWLFQQLVAEQYRAHSHLLPWVVLAGGIFAAGQVLALKLMSEMKSSHMITPKIVSALAGVLLHVLGAALAGIDGVVTALIAFSVIYLLWMVVLGRYSSAEHAAARTM